MRKLVAWGVIVSSWVAATALLAAHPPKLPASRAASRGSLVGKPAPTVKLKDLDGREFDLAAQRGKVVVLDFTATWRPPSREALPHTDRLSQRPEALDGRLQVVAIVCGEEPATVRAFCQRQQLHLRVLCDAGWDTLRRYHADGVPTFVVIKRDGTVAYHHVGYEHGADQRLDAAVEQALSQR